MTAVKVHASSVEMIPVGALKGYDRNARTHPEEQIEALVAIIADSGFTNPLLIDEAGTIIAGHGRLEAAQRLGMDALPCIRVAGLTDEQIRALRISDNAVGLRSGWDEDLLRSELEALAAVDFGLDVIGFDEVELSALLNPPSESQADPEATPEPPAEPVSRLGDIWVLGKHRIACGDSTDAATVEALLAGGEPVLMVTDPPYGIGYGYDTHDDRDPEANADLVERVFAHAPPGKVWTPGLMNLARDVERFGRSKVLCWHKGFAASGNGIGGASTWEPVLVINPPIKRLANDYLDFKVVIEQHDGRSLREYHPCPKPVALYAHLIEAFSPKGAGLYEPFSGSGTTIIAAEKTGRRCYAAELSPAYVDVAVRRWQSFAGQEATHAETGQTFAQVAEERIGALSEGASPSPAE